MIVRPRFVRLSQQRGGGAEVTDLGLEVIEGYRKMEAKAPRILDRDMASFAKLLTERARKG